MANPLPPLGRSALSDALVRAHFGAGGGSAHPLAGVAWDVISRVAGFQRKDEPGGTYGYWRQALKAFDPRTTEGIANLATILVPGPKGGAAAQRAYMEQLQLVNPVRASDLYTPGNTLRLYRKTYRKQDPSGRGWVFDPRWREGMSGREIGEVMRNPIPYEQMISLPMNEARVEADPGVTALARHLGYTAGKPLLDLNLQPGLTSGKLGLGRDT